jgi:hypothetical protein
MGLGSEIRYPRSGIRKKPILDLGSRGQKGTGSRISDPQHWMWLKQGLVISHCTGGRFLRDTSRIFRQPQIPHSTSKAIPT